MSERHKIVSRLITDREYRADYIRAKLEVLIPSQLRAMRLRQDKTQPELAQMAGMKQSRISAMETPGKVNFNLDTLVRMAATHKVGLAVEFVPFSEMLGRENEYSQDSFNVTRLDDDVEFLQPARALRVSRRVRRNRGPRYARSSSASRIFQVPIAAAHSPYLPHVRQERTQLRLQFEAMPKSEPANLIVMPSRSGSVSNLPIQKTAVGAGASYGNTY